jgi:hypothetical protein
MTNRGSAWLRWTRSAPGIGASMALALALSTHAAYAQETTFRTQVFTPDSPWETHPVSILAHVGAGTPLGITGVTLEYAATPWWMVGGGFGTNTRRLNAGADTGPQLVLGEYLALGLRMGGAYGAPYSRCLLASHETCDPPDARLSAYGYLYLEARATRGFLGRLYGGASNTLAPESERAAQASLAPFVGLAFGTLL